MSEILQVERLQLQAPDETALAAARLLMREIHVLARFRTPQGFLENCDPATHELDALMQGPDSLVAAMLTHANESTTVVRALAVAPECRGCGYCRTLMQHAASRAIDRGQSRLSLKPWGQGELVYSRLGFQYDTKGRLMEASPQTVLTS